MAETIGECIEKFGNIDYSNIEKTNQDFEILKEALKSMIPHLDGFDILVGEVRAAHFVDDNEPESEIIETILLSGGRDRVDFPYGLYDGYGDMNDFLNKNPGFKELYRQYTVLREDMNNSTSISNATAQALADCLKEITEGQ